MVDSQRDKKKQKSKWSFFSLHDFKKNEVVRRGTWKARKSTSAQKHDQSEMQ
jgi:hypothetical protein